MLMGKAIDWAQVSNDLDAYGSAVIENLISPGECNSLAALYQAEERFRSRVVMERHGFGRGQYKYFSYPLPDVVARLRTTIYPHLAPIANRWNEELDVDTRFPEKHLQFIERCHAAGQRRPTPRRAAGSPEEIGDIELARAGADERWDLDDDLSLS